MVATQGKQLFSMQYVYPYFGLKNEIILFSLQILEEMLVRSTKLAFSKIS